MKVMMLITATPSSNDQHPHGNKEAQFYIHRRNSNTCVEELILFRNTGAAASHVLRRMVFLVPEEKCRGSGKKTSEQRKRVFIYPPPSQHSYREEERCLSWKVEECADDDDDDEHYHYHRPK